ncbi:MAG TPA: hypothetical protein VJP86_09845 [Vicinamibacterales bacterium]|jgi:hypothetical protein|nr:hypothetical protein [Vicinamibacterales bacterium]
MSFEEELHRAIDALADRLRHDAADHFQARMVDFQRALERDRARAADAARHEVERESEGKLAEATARASEAESRAHEAETRLHTVESRLEEAESRAQAAESRARDAEARAEDADARVQDADTRAQDADTRAQDAESRASRAETRIADAEAKLADFESKLAGVEEAAVPNEQAGAPRADLLAIDRKEDQAGFPLADLVQRIRSLDTAPTLSALLGELATAAAERADAAAVFLVRGGIARSWKLTGFGELDAAESFEMPMSDLGIVARSIEQAGIVLGDSRQDADVPGFSVSVDSPRELAAVPLLVGGQVSAVVYAERATPGGGRAWSDSLEVVTRHAARALEAMTVLKSIGRPVSSARTPAAQTTNDDGDDEDAMAARRYARLLLSEIKLYHETDVLIGRHERNLVERLGGEIARARSLYEERVPARVRDVRDYFHTELVATLANGDASLLGGDTNVLRN